MEDLIYILDKDIRKREPAEGFLRSEGFSVHGFSAIDRLSAAIADCRPALLIVDLASCESCGMHAALSQLAETQLPLIALQKQENAVERITALKLGADLCLQKEELLPLELSAVVRALLRRIELEQKRTAVPLSELICYGDITLNPHSHSSLIGDTEFYLTPHEFTFLRVLFQHRGAVRKEELAACIWGEAAAQLTPRAVDDLVKRLRKKLRRLDSRVLIISVWAYGYRPDIDTRCADLAEEFANLQSHAN